VDGAAGIADFAAAAGFDFGGVVDELPHAAAISAIGIRAAAVQARRILLATGGYSFTNAR